MKHASGKSTPLQKWVVPMLVIVAELPSQMRPSQVATGGVYLHAIWLGKVLGVGGRASMSPTNQFKTMSISRRLHT